jgi:hypothetical protein
VTGKNARLAKLRAQLDGVRLEPSGEEHTHCYCDAWGLTYPHYRAEHTAEHDDAQALRAMRAGGSGK